MTGWLDRFQRKQPAFGFPIAVIYKYMDDQGGYLAALMAYYGFLSLFPLLLLLASILGLVLQNNPHAQEQILNSTISQFPVVGQELSSTEGLQVTGVALAIGLIGLVLGVLGAAVAFQNAMNVAWGVPRNERPNPFVSRARGLLLIGPIGLAIVAVTVLTAMAGAVGSYGPQLGSWLHLGLLIASVLVNTFAFALAFRIATARSLTLRDMLPGALGAAIFWQILQTFGTLYVSRVIQHSSATSGVFAVVLGLMAWIYLAAQAIVLCVEINVVWSKRLFPRALLTPFTENVELSRGDRRVYSGAAKAQRFKRSQRVEVEFDQPEPKATEEEQNSSDSTVDPDTAGSS
jgi:membrane protein